MSFKSKLSSSNTFVTHRIKIVYNSSLEGNQEAIDKSGGNRFADGYMGTR